MALDQCLEQLDVITPGRGFIRLNERLTQTLLQDHLSCHDEEGGLGDDAYFVRKKPSG